MPSDYVSIKTFVKSDPLLVILVYFEMVDLVFCSLQNRDEIWSSYVVRHWLFLHRVDCVLEFFDFH